MNLDDRLRRLAHHVDAELAASNAVDASIEPSTVIDLDAHRTTRRRPGLAAVTAAAVITVGAGGLVVASWSRDATPAAGTTAPVSAADADTSPAELPPPAERRPRLPTVYPAVDQQIDGATAALGSYSMIGYPDLQRVEALIGIVTDTTLTGGIQIDAVAGTRAEAQLQFMPVDTVGPTSVTTTIAGTSGSGPEPVEPPRTEYETIELWGREADVYTEPGTPQLKTVVIDVAYPSVATTLRFTGLDPLAILQGSEEFVDVVPIPPVDDSGAPPFTLVFAGDLPADYSIVDGPTVTPNGGVVGSLSVNNTDSVEGNLIQVSTYNPLIAHAAAGSLTAVDVNGTGAWMGDGAGHAVIWQVNDATYALVGGSATTDEAIAVAQSVTFTDEATWRDRYQVPEPDFGIPGNLRAATDPATQPEPTTGSTPVSTTTDS